YGDFSGYSDLAMGTAHLLGYRLAVNFNMPYLSANLSEFWRRWHISLSTWLRDYLFVSLGGSRHGRWRTYWNLFLTMTVCGLWHGATWNFVLFGALQGVLLIPHRLFHGWCANRQGLTRVLESRLGTAWRISFTFLVFCLTLVVFRTENLARTGVYFEH